MLSLSRGLSLTSGKGGASEPFDPLTIFADEEEGAIYDCTDADNLWSDVNGGMTSLAADGNAVGTVTDLSGNDNHLTASNTAFRPTHETGGGLRWIEFDGIAHELAASFTASQPVTVVASMRMIASVAFGGLISSPFGIGGGALYTPTVNQLSIYAGGGGAVGAIAAADGEDFVATYRLSGATSRIAKNAGSYTTGDPGSGNPGGIVVGSQGSASDYTAMRLYRCIIVARDMTDQEIIGARQYCAAGAGVSL